MEPVTILPGDCRVTLATLPAASVHCVVTSPPYWGLRAYGTEPQVWGGDPACAHEWQTEIKRRAAGGEREYGSYDGGVGRGPAPAASEGACCTHCNAWRGELGQEPTPDLFVAHLVEVFRAVRRVLRSDGTCWIVIGDSYANDSKWSGATGGKHVAALHGATSIGRTKRAAGGDKQLLLMPARVALALQADGWVLRNDIAWVKAAPMPESVQDRCTQAHEHIFLFSPRPRYYFDAEAIKEPAIHEGRIVKASGSAAKNAQGATETNDRRTALGFTQHDTVVTNRNCRDTWILGPDPLPDAHYAAFPRAIPQRAVLAGTSARGACPACGACWRRVVVRTQAEKTAWATRKAQGHPMRYGNTDSGSAKRCHFTSIDPPVVATINWQPGCRCNAGDPVPCVVLDPFAGSGRTLAVARSLGRYAVGCELQAAYLPLIAQQIAAATPYWVDDGAAGPARAGWADLPLFAGVA